MYVQVRAFENRIPIQAANVENQRFGWNSLIVDLAENNNDNQSLQIEWRVRII
jgi:omega-amidase